MTAGIAGAAPAPAVGQTTEEQAAAPAPELRVSARKHVRAGRSAPVRGALSTGEAGRTVAVQVKRGRGWRTVDRTLTRDEGRFRARWRTKSPGRFRIRARLLDTATPAAVAARRVKGRVHVYRPALASWYGPGLYGNRTACGQTLGSGTVGVAHKSLPCGTRVTFRYRGRTATVPVIDRGPYVGAREFDLTYATKRKLGFGSTGYVLSTR